MQRFLAILGVLGLVTWSVFGIFKILPTRDQQQRSGHISKAEGETRQLALATYLYTTEHQGTLPRTGETLIPKYLPDDRLLNDSQWIDTTAESHDVTSRYVIAARSVFYDDELIAVVLALSDGTIKTIRNEN